MNRERPDRDADGATSSGPAPALRLSVVVPAWNAGRILEPHLPRMADEARSLAGGAEIVVVDDGSDVGDTLAEVVATGGAGIRLIRRRHEGFAAACNAGVAAAAGEYVLLLNTDMHVEPGCFEVLLATLAPRPELFAVTPVIVNLRGGFPESTTRIRFWRGVFDLLLPGKTGEAPPAAGELRPIAFGCAGALLCRRAEYLTFGGLSSLYAPIYWDDADLSWRARRAGFGVVEVGGARVLHDHAQTVGAQVASRRVRTLFERNRLLFTWVHLVGAGAWASHALWFVPRLLAAVARRDATALGMLTAFTRLGLVARDRRGVRYDRERARALQATVHSAGARGWPSA